jgi:hypothetical protein
LAAEDVKGLYFFIFNLIKGNGELISLNERFINNNIHNFNGIKFPSKYGFTEIIGMPTNIQSDNYLSGIKNYESASDINIWTFDYNKRKWSVNEYNNKRMDKFLPKLKDDNFEPLLKSISDKFTKNIKFKYEKHNYNNQFIASRMYEYFKLSDVLQFNTRGFLKREVGDLYLVASDSKSAFFERYAGVWCVTRIYHNFTKNDYTQNITLIRSNKYKYDENDV